MAVLTNKSYKEYRKVSRYAIFPYYYNSRFDKYNYGTTAYLLNSTNYQLYKVQANDTYDSIALEFYNNPTYYWVILSYNHILDPFEKPLVGSYIKIPTLSTIEFEK